MRYNDVKFCAALAIACAGSVPAWAADPTFVGDWNVTFFWSPTARLAQPNALSSHPCQVRLPACRPRGTWSSPTFAGWHGQWIELGDHVRFFGVTGGGLSTEESGNVIEAALTGGVSFNHFFSSSGATSSAGSWVAERVTACRSGTAQLRSSDPSQ